MKNKIILMLCVVFGLILIPKMNVNAEASDVLREGLKNRENNITVYYETTDEDHSMIADNISKEALKHTGVSTEGDYIKYHLMSDLTGRITNKTFEDDKCTLEIKYSPRYLSTLEQEKELDSILSEFYNSINLDEMNDYDKLKTVYDYICDNLEYGYWNNSAYSALTNGSGNCRSYALLFYRMALDLGYDARIISGRVVGGSYDNYHEWNIVNIGDKYYNVDVNFGDNIGGNARYTYFLKGSNGIFKDGYGSYVPAHVRDEEFDNDEFNIRHPMSEVDFNKNTIIPEVPSKPNEPEVEVPVIPEVPEDTTEKDEIVEDNTEDDVVIEDKEDVEDTEDEIIEEDKDEEDVSDNVVEGDKEDVEDESSKEEDSNTENDKEDDEAKEDVDDKVETSNKFHGLFKKLSRYITKIKDGFFRFFR